MVEHWRCGSLSTSVSTCKFKFQTLLNEIETKFGFEIIFEIFRLRYTQPNLVRPIRVNLFWPILYLIATIFVTVVPMYASPVETGYGCLMILTSVPVYFIFVAWKKKPKCFQKAMGKFSVFDFLLTLS